MIAKRSPLTLDDLARMRVEEEQRQKGKAPWHQPPANAPDKNGPVHRVTLTTGTTPR